jgi:SAM-dependent MidA family methyltransferase
MERFDYYMDRCLYHPTAGFYAASHGVAGRRGGDFITSPEVGPLFGAVIARAVDGWWHDAGRPDHLLVVDAGAGPGTLTRSLAAASPECASAWELVAVDPNGREGTRPDLPEDLTGAVVIANELLDNLPFRIVERGESGWLEVFVENGREVLQPTTFAPSFDLAVGQRAPLLERASHWVSEVLARGAAELVVFDYGVSTTAALAERGGWLRTYRRHGRGSDPYAAPGELDITSDLAVDQLPPPSRVGTQAEFLRGHDIEDLVEEGRQYWQAHAARPDLQALRMRSRVREAEALLDPVGLGSWLCLEWSRR